MSIPPLVCSTPPPPDQCEDDKDTEDFDLQYNLSQEDDNDYFGNYSTYSNFQCPILDNSNSNTPVIAMQNCQEESTSIDTQEKSDIKHDVEESDKKYAEDVNVEDLNLKLNEESTEIDTKYSNERIYDDSMKGQVGNVLDVTDNECDRDVCMITSPSESIVGSTNLNQIEVSHLHLNEEVKDKLCDINLENVNAEILDSEKNISVNYEEIEIDGNENSDIEIKLDHVEGDDFGDFEDFNFVNSDKKPATVIDICDNPWQNQETKDSKFEEFKANFDENEINLNDKSVVNNENFHQSILTEIQADIDTHEDDFGDFDDFKCTEGETNEELKSSLCQQVSALNLQSADNENQVIEKLNNILSAIFPHELSVPENEFEGKLESLLSETWGYLIEMDVRQPYMVNWNSSSGQKSLLKSLCIDSRNILYGPKWTYNMPKYAANLSSAPLQPQKQPAIFQNETVNPDNSLTKPTDSWTDPFSSDGQQSCNTDNEKASIQTRPTDLSIFDAAVTAKPNKIYSTTLDVQPLRQINLPDTHIFTPTDSEVPRSKTIHYDSVSPVLMPQPVIEENKNQPESLMPKPLKSNDVTYLENDTEYSEFQDFQGKSVHHPGQSVPTEKNVEVTKSDNTYSYQTQILQPIKLDPIMPILNWPDPGQVKETFDDFSDFASKSSWNDEKQDTSHTSIITYDSSKSVLSTENMEDNKNDMVLKDAPSKLAQNFDDEFDTFQSALPTIINAPNEHNCSNSKNHLANINNYNQSISPQNSSDKVSDLDIVFSSSNNSQSNNISFMNASIKNEVLLQSQISNNNDVIPKPLEPIIKNSTKQSLEIPMINTNLLQPISANHNASPQIQQTGQILQPLSLESYSQINWPSPGIDLQDLSRFNPVETFPSLKSDANASGNNKISSPAHSKKNVNQAADDDIWGEFVSSKPKQQQSISQKSSAYADDDEWTDFVSSPSIKPQNGLNTISLNVHTNSNMQKSSNQSKFASLDIPTLNYITPKSNNHRNINERNFQNL